MSVVEIAIAEQTSRDPLNPELLLCVIDAFDVNELERFVRTKMGPELVNQIGWGEALDKIVYDLLRRADKEGLTTKLLLCMKEAKPNRAELIEAIDKLLRALEQPRTAKEDGRRVAEVLGGLESQAKSIPEVRDVIDASRGKLEQLRADIETLFNYKKLHDCLHEIQVKLYPQIADDVKQFRTNTQAPLELDVYIYQLDKTCRGAREAAQCLPDTAAIRADETQWVTKLESALKEMSAALERQDDLAFRVPLYSIKQMLRREPDHINKRLTNVANQLPLDDLAKTIRDAVDKVAVAGRSAAELQGSVDSIERLSTQLKARVAEHGVWQEVEKYLWEAEDCLERRTPESVEEFSIVWELIKSGIAVLEQTAQEKDWAKATKKCAVLIDQGLKNAPEVVVKAFEVFRETALFHFYWVDKELKARCEDILKIREPLGSLLDKV